jgi:hypothetical protein
MVADSLFISEQELKKRRTIAIENNRENLDVMLVSF